MTKLSHRKLSHLTEIAHAGLMGEMVVDVVSGRPDAQGRRGQGRGQGRTAQGVRHQERLSRAQAGCHIRPGVSRCRAWSWCCQPCCSCSCWCCSQSCTISGWPFFRSIRCCRAKAGCSSTTTPTSARISSSASFWLGTVYAVASIVLQVLMGVGAALILNEAFWGRSLLRGVVLFPYMIPTIVAVIVWKWIFNDQYGIVNYWLMALGLVSQPVVWLARAHLYLAIREYLDLFSVCGDLGRWRACRRCRRISTMPPKWTVLAPGRALPTSRCRKFVPCCSL